MFYRRDVDSDADPALFRGGELHDWLDQRKRRAIEAADAMARDALINEPLDRIGVGILDEYQVEEVVIAQQEEIECEQADGNIPTNDFGRRIMVKGTVFTFHVPFTGEPELLSLRGSHMSSLYPRGNVEGQTIVFRVRLPEPTPDEVKQRVDQNISLLQQWLTGVNPGVRAFNQELAGIVTQRLQERRARVLSTKEIVASLGFKAKATQSASPDTQPSASNRPNPGGSGVAEAPEYDVAVSFAGEDRSKVEAVVDALKRRGIKVFYDKDVEAELWGKNLVDHLHDVYLRRARFCIMFVSKAYAHKAWPRHERQAAQERAFKQSDMEYILPVRIDDTDVPGVPSTIGYVRMDQGPEHVADLVCSKLSLK